ncbi:unnamed protein product [Lampetra fluviatilis]
MSKSGARRKITPGVQADQEDGSSGDLTKNPEIGAPETRPAEVARLEPEEAEAGGADLPPSDVWRDIAAKLELLQLTMAQLTVAVAEVGVRIHTAGDDGGRHRDFDDDASPAKFELGAILPTGTPRQLGAILHTTPPPGTIFHATPEPGTIDNAMPEVAAMTPVIAAPMGAAAPHVAADANAGSPRATVARLAEAADADRAGTSPRAAGAAGAPRPSVAAAAVEAPTGTEGTADIFDHPTGGQGDAAYPKLEGRALDSLALERLLILSGELGIALSISEESKITSLAVAQNIQAHLALRRPPAMAACAGAPAPAVVAEPREEDALAAVATYNRRGEGWRCSPAREAVASRPSSFAGQGAGHLLPLWPAGPLRAGLQQRPRGLRQGLPTCEQLSGGGTFGATGKSRRIHCMAAPFTSCI